MSTAEQSQREVIQILKSKNVWFKPYWISNVIAVENAPLDLISELAQRDDVKEIRSDRAFKVDLEQADISFDQDAHQQQIECIFKN
jgi:hypothetical protein